MPFRGRLKKKAQEEGCSELELCKRRMEEYNDNIILAAASLSVYPNAIRYHLDKAKKEAEARAVANVPA